MSKKTSLNAAHRQLGARMVDFGGWDMPVQYSGIKDEHAATRAAAGLFDVSHMGEIEVRGQGARDAVQHLTPNDVSKLSPGRVQYSALTTPAGTFVDDILVYCRAEDDYLLVVNAANIDKDFDWINKNLTAGATATNVSDWFAQLALQGPKSKDVMRRLAPEVDLDGLGYYRFVNATVAGHPGCILSRTGYTGEYGYEVYLAAERGPELWRSILSGGETEGVRPCGLGARDTLRLEAKLALYGNDIDDTTTVIEADLGWIVKPDKGEFIGRDVLARQKTEGVSRKLVGFAMAERGVPRHGHPVHVAGQPFGQVTSGGFAPHLEKNIGLAYLPTEHSEPGAEFDVEIRNKRVRARVVETPFVPHRTRPAKKK